jgi:hypothetical protein
VACELCQAIQMPSKRRKCEVALEPPQSSDADGSASEGSNAERSSTDATDSSSKDIVTVVWEEGVVPSDAHYCPEPDESENPEDWKKDLPKLNILYARKPKKVEYCEHEKNRKECADCKINGTGGSALCDAHFRRKYSCNDCRGLYPKHGSLRCDHGKITAHCVTCKYQGTGGWLLCHHDHLHNICKSCEREKKQRAEQQERDETIPPSVQFFRDAIVEKTTSRQAPAPEPAGDSDSRVIFTFGNGWAPLSGRAGPSHSLS